MGILLWALTLALRKTKGAQSPSLMNESPAPPVGMTDFDPKPPQAEILAGDSVGKGRVPRVAKRFGLKRELKRALTTVCLAVLATGNSLAAQASDVSTPTNRARSAPVFTLYYENDVFYDADGYYTNGVKLSWLSAEFKTQTGGAVEFGSVSLSCAF